MLKLGKNKILLTIIMMVFCFAIGVTASTSKPKYNSYVEIYSPTDSVDIGIQNSTYFNASVIDDAKTPSGKGLVLDYKVGYPNSLSVTIPISTTSFENFEGLALWLDIPRTSDSYSFTLYIENKANDWQTMDFGTELTLINSDGSVSTVNSLWKRQQLNGFSGWLLLPKEAYVDPIPDSDGLYNMIFMIENDEVEGFYKTEDMKMTIGSIGYYTDYVDVLYEMAGSDSMGSVMESTLDKYILDASNLKPKNDEQIEIKNHMLVYFSNIRENYKSLPVSEQINVFKGLYDVYYSNMEKFLYGEIRKTDYVMSFAIMSDTHFTQEWNNERFIGALEDAKTLKPDLTAALVLGDLSDNGVSTTDESHTELDNYYDFIDSYEYKNEKGEDIPIYNVLGNHDVRGHHLEGYPEASYQPAIDMYLEREKVDSIQFDKWINGYHFIFLNTDKYHSDNCYLSGETIDWLDETLSENEDGRPIFVMVHQPMDKVITMDGAKMSFEEVIARHPSAIVSSGHEHAAFGNAKIVQEGNGVYVNQPAMVNVQAQYYIVEVYEGGVIYRARESATSSWLIGSDVVVSNEDMSNNILLSADSFELESDSLISKINYDSISGSALKMVGSISLNSVSLPINAKGINTNYEGYAIFIESDKDISLEFDGKKLKNSATYYKFVNGQIEEAKTSASGDISASGWVVIPKDIIDGEVYPSKENVLSINLNDEQVVLLDQVSYYFDLDDFTNSICDLSYSFYIDDELILSKEVEYGANIEVPMNIDKDDTVKYTYEFIGWDINGDNEVDTLPKTLKGNIIAKAIFNTTIRKYTYTLYASDGKTIIDSQTLEYGSTITAPSVDNLYGWDIDGDGAVENLPITMVGDFSAVAVIGIPKYNHADVVYDPSTVSDVAFKTSSWVGTPTSYTFNALPIVNANSPTGKVAQFTYNYKAEHTSGVYQLTLSIPYNKVYSGFQGYAIWLDIAATGEDYIGGLNINSLRGNKTTANGLILIDVNGNITYQDCKYTNEGYFPNVCANGFTGWLIIDKKSYVDSSITESMIAPSSTGNLQFRINGGTRTTSYTINIGEVLVYNDLNGLISELTNNEKNVLEYSFTDGNGYVYKAGQIAKGEQITYPNNPVHDDTNIVFVGWDINEDGYPDELPEDGIINDSLKAIALFYHVDAFETFSEGDRYDWNLDGKYIKMSNVEYSDSPSNKAVKFSINKDLNGTGVVYANLSLKTNDDAKGIAFWMDSSSLSSFGMRMWKNWIAKGHVNDGGDYVYLYTDSGMLYKITNWRTIPVPSNFKGWVIIPLDCFVGFESIYNGDIIKLGFAFGEDGNASNFSGDIYIGEAVTYNCSPELFIKQIDKKVYGFKDWNDTFIAGDVITSLDEFMVPENPTRDDWRFVGWDIDGDGIVDEIPDSFDRNFVAKAIYTREFTYKFVDQDNNVILEKTTEYNSIILPPFYYGIDDLEYAYFIEHIDYVEGMLLTDNIVFKVNVTKEVKKYLITFVDEFGNVLQEEYLNYGQVPSYNGETLVKAETEKYMYEFIGWDKDIVGANGNVCYKPVFKEIIKEFKVVFLDSDKKTVLFEIMVPYGNLAEYSGNTPSKESDAEYKYIFIGWDKEFSPITASQTYVAVYDKEPIDGHYHYFSGDWIITDQMHWHECECGDKEDEMEHEYFMNVIKEATLDEEGLIEYKCSYCQHSYTEVIPVKKGSNSKGCNGSYNSVLISTLCLGLVVILLKRRKVSFK